MDPRRQRHVQRYGWDLAVGAYEALWQARLAPGQAKLLDCAALAPGDRVLDVASGTGVVSFAAARSVGKAGSVVGVDLSGVMIETARRRADVHRVANVGFVRMDAGKLGFPDASFDVALCAMGLMYTTDPARALGEMRRALRPGGRLAVSAWGEPSKCGLDTAFAALRGEIPGDLSPSFVGLGQGDSLSRACAEAGFGEVGTHRVPATLAFASDDEACRAAFTGGPLALAWSRLGDAARERLRGRFLEAIAPWRHKRGYRIPAEFVVASGRAPEAPPQARDARGTGCVALAEMQLAKSRAPGSGLAIRDMESSEAGTLGHLLVRAYSGLEGFPSPVEQPAYYDMLANVWRLLEKPATRILVAVTAEGERAGCVVYFGDMAHYGSGGLATQARNSAGVRLLAVEPSLRNRGAGRALTQACIDLARRQGKGQVILHTTRAMKVAWEMYERLGFARSGELDFSQHGLPVFGFRLILGSGKT
jgi:SAM-dependent methyltransferase/GNAT superfamily N-acetyltransferase